MRPLHNTLRRSIHGLGGPLITRRWFAQSPAIRAAPDQLMPQRPATKSDRSMRILAKAGGELPSDFGILDNTFIMPTGKNLPSPFQRPRAFLKVQYRRVRIRFTNLVSLLLLKILSPKGTSFFRRKFVLQKSHIIPLATKLHNQMYTCFAEGDIPALRKLCADGMYTSLRARIDHRAPGEKVQWELLRYTKKSKLVSDRGVSMPGGTGNVFRQVVVRISSTQKLARTIRAKGKETALGSGKEKDVVEYVVLQQRWHAWRPGSWEVWGTTQETTVGDLEAWDRKALE